MTEATIDFVSGWIGGELKRSTRSARAVMDLCSLGVSSYTQLAVYNFLQALPVWWDAIHLILSR